MRCTNCDTMVMPSDPICPVCRQRVRVASGVSGRPVFTSICMCLALAFAMSQSKKPLAGRTSIDWAEVGTAGIFGGIGATIGGVLDWLFLGRRQGEA
jgi:hypothetical protein